RDDQEEQAEKGCHHDEYGRALREASEVHVAKARDEHRQDYGERNALLLHLSWLPGRRGRVGDAICSRSVILIGYRRGWFLGPSRWIHGLTHLGDHTSVGQDIHSCGIVDKDYVCP